MTPRSALKHQFVDFIPEELSEDTVYVSIRFATASHLCCCGCRNKVVTPIQPTDWKLIFDGKTISLDPSIGNWNFPCRSHYWVRNNKVIWAEQWSRDKIETAKKSDRGEKQRYYLDGVGQRSEEEKPVKRKKEKGILQKIMKTLGW